MFLEFSKHGIEELDYFFLKNQARRYSIFCNTAKIWFFPNWLISTTSNKELFHNSLQHLKTELSQHNGVAYIERLSIKDSRTRGNYEVSAALEGVDAIVENKMYRVNPAYMPHLVSCPSHCCYFSYWAREGASDVLPLSIVIKKSSRQSYSELFLQMKVISIKKCKFGFSCTFL